MHAYGSGHPAQAAGTPPPSLRKCEREHIIDEALNSAANLTMGTLWGTHNNGTKIMAVSRRSRLDMSLWCTYVPLGVFSSTVRPPRCRETSLEQRSEGGVLSYHTVW